MSKVICIKTREELTTYSFTIAEGEMLLECLINFNMTGNSGRSLQARRLALRLIDMVENNSGASHETVIDRMYKQDTNQGEKI